MGHQATEDVCYVVLPPVKAAKACGLLKVFEDDMMGLFAQPVLL